MNLCHDHAPVVRNLSDKVHVGEHDVENVAAMFARCCLDCIALQTAPEPLVDVASLDPALAAATALAAEVVAVMAEATAA